MSPIPEQKVGPGMRAGGMHEWEGTARGWDGERGRDGEREGESKRMGERESRRDGERDRVSHPRTRGR